MGYRDEREASMQRAASLEAELAEARTAAQSNAAQRGELEARLAQAHAEITRLGGTPATEPRRDAPLAPANRRILAAALTLAIGGLVAVAVAGYQSEQLGVQVALLGLPLWGAFFGAWLRRRASTFQCLVAAALGVVVVLFALIFFFATVWRAL